MNVGSLLLKYQTDKNRGNTPQKDGHFYGESYDYLFGQFDKDSEIKILEVGVQKGGSLLAWKDYFKNGYVVGVDIIDVRLDEYKRDDVNFIVSDSNNLQLKDNKFIKDTTFDIIIDDGSHMLNDVTFFLDNYINKLNINGYYIIEDTQSPGHWDSVISSRLDKSKYEISNFDLREVNGYYDDYLIVIKRVK